MPQEDIYKIEDHETLQNWYDDLDKAFETENVHWLQKYSEQETVTEGRIHVNKNINIHGR